MTKASWGSEWDIYVRDGCVCTYCGLWGDSLLLWRQLCLDHIIPQSVGGTDVPENLTVACNYCNQMKGGYDPRTGPYVTPPSDPIRQDLIERARRHILDAIDRSYEAAGEELKDFNQMMSEILEKGAKGGA